MPRMVTSRMTSILEAESATGAVPSLSETAGRRWGKRGGRGRRPRKVQGEITSCVQFPTARTCSWLSSASVIGAQAAEPTEPPLKPDPRVDVPAPMGVSVTPGV